MNHLHVTPEIDSQSDPGKSRCQIIIDDDDWLESEIPQRAWLAKGYLIRGSVTMVVGPPAVSKSSLALSYAVSLALNRPIGCFKPVEALRVLSLNCEDDLKEQRRRLSAVLRTFGATLSDIKGRVIRSTVKETGLMVGHQRDRYGQSLGVGPLDAFDKLERLITAHKPDVLMLDPLIELHDQAENDNTALRAVVAQFRTLAQRHDMAVLLVHHSRKGPNAPGDMDNARGGSSIVGAVRVFLTLTTMTDDEAKLFNIHPEQRQDFFRVDDGKSNYGPLSRPEWFEKRAYAIGNGEFIMAVTPWSPPRDVLTAENLIDLEEGVARGHPDEGPWSNRWSGDARSIKHLLLSLGLTTKDGHAQAMRHLTARGFSSQAFKRKNRGAGQGLRAPDGRPNHVKWEDDEEG